MTKHVRHTLENLGKGALELRVDPDVFSAEHVAQIAARHQLTTSSECTVALTGTETWDALRTFTQALLQARIQGA